MYQHITNSCKYVSLGLPQLNQKKSFIEPGGHTNRYGYEYGSDYNIQSSWAQGKHDALRDSMVAYTKRMSDIRRIRGINVKRHVEHTSNTPALWINSSNCSSQFDMMADKKQHPAHHRLTKSLGTIKLQPLLGSKRVSREEEITLGETLQTHKVEEKEAVKLKHITVTISIPSTEQQSEPQRDSPAQPVPNEALTRKLVPLGGGKARPRKAKRMKISEPSLESINEDVSETNIHNQEIEESYSHLLNDVYSLHEHMIYHKRRTTALLKQTNYAHPSHQRSRQIAMTVLARKKFRKLAVAPSVKPSLRYTNGNSPAKSPYDGNAELLPTMECG